MKRILTTGITLLLASLVQTALAAEAHAVRGADLKKICTSFDDIPASASDGMCVGYVVGVMSVMEYINVLCLPGEASHAQMTLVVQKYLADNPAKLHLDAEQLVIDALQEAFPCSDASML
ncbi:MAG TPA: Rap1a/Tai family immunity protein [Gammaproteobacteria bacterium]|nr:Rap1a/Tai family immunity protein [Gammaproteobacteria bacterium]